MHVKIYNSKIIDKGPRPKWRYPSNHPDYPGELVTNDAVYRAGGIDPALDAAGWFEVVDDGKPTHDPVTERPPKPKPQEQWTIETDRVIRTWYAPEPKPVSDRQTEMTRQAEQQYQEALRTGFTDADGIAWQATQAARDVVLDLTQRIQEFRAGTMSTELPKGKAKAKLKDAAGNPVEVTPTKVIALAEQGSDFKEDAQDHFEALVGQIMAATSHADLDAIDVTAGWPS